MAISILSRSDLKPAQTLFKRAYHFSRKWSKTVEELRAKWGERPQGGFVSGIYSEHFPQSAQDQLRAMANLVRTYSDAAWKAFPPRIRHHTKMALKQAVIAKYGKGYYG